MNDDNKLKNNKISPAGPGDAPVIDATDKKITKEVGGRDGLDPTRYNDWEINGKCVDF